MSTTPIGIAGKGPEARRPSAKATSTKSKLRAPVRDLQVLKLRYVPA
jgi:hypothetical protein